MFYFIFFPPLPGQSRSSILKVVAFVPQEQKSNNVCEHLVYKCLQYLIFVIKKRGKNPLGLSFFPPFFFCKAFLTHIQGRLKGFIKTASFMAFFVLIKSTHTLSKKERKKKKEQHLVLAESVFPTCQSFFGSINVTANSVEA